MPSSDGRHSTPCWHVKPHHRREIQHAWDPEHIQEEGVQLEDEAHRDDERTARTKWARCRVLCMSPAPELSFAGRETALRPRRSHPIVRPALEHRQHPEVCRRSYTAPRPVSRSCAEVFQPALNVNSQPNDTDTSSDPQRDRLPPKMPCRRRIRRTMRSTLNLTSGPPACRCDSSPR